VVVAGKGRIQTPCLARYYGKDIISTAANTIDITMVNSTRTRTGGKGPFSIPLPIISPPPPPLIIMIMMT
jgi:hypothetical protein